MKKSRLEAFSDGVIAILITIMVLELHVPHAGDLAALRPLLPVLLCYVLSFVYIGIYWNNHHHMFQLVSRVSGAVLWANSHLLFWLSLLPFATAWMGENSFAPWPVALYGFVLFGAGCAYFVLARLLVRLEGAHSPLARAVGETWKERFSSLACGVAVPLAFVNRWLSCAIYVVVAAVWLVPDSRIERRLEETG